MRKDVMDIREYQRLCACLDSLLDAGVNAEALNASAKRLGIAWEA